MKCITLLICCLMFFGCSKREEKAAEESTEKTITKTTEEYTLDTVAENPTIGPIAVKGKLIKVSYSETLTEREAYREMQSNQTYPLADLAVQGLKKVADIYAPGLATTLFSTGEGQAATAGGLSLLTALGLAALKKSNEKKKKEEELNAEHLRHEQTKAQMAAMEARMVEMEKSLARAQQSEDEVYNDYKQSLKT